MAGTHQSDDIKDEPQPMQVERTAPNADDEQLKHRFQNLDEFGAHKKTDPAEIALVRRMDWHIIVSLGQMFLWEFSVIMSVFQILFFLLRSSPWDESG